MYNTLKQTLDAEGLTVVERFVLPSRPAAYAPVPALLATTAVGEYLALAAPEGLWQHQAAALEALGHHQNVVIPTGTASGKSLIFRSIAFHRILSNPNCRVLVFYPLKALASDQVRGWRAMAQALGMPDGTIGRIDGSVSLAQRDNILLKARIVVMTPDVCHAWLMSRLAMPVVKLFLTQLAIVVMDEAHTLEGVFGSNFAYLIRRLQVARHHLQKQIEPAQELQFIAATATILHPEEHLAALTGVEFEVVPEVLDGSPRSERICAHVAAPPGEEMELAKALHKMLLDGKGGGGFITFMDSRKGVEMLARDNTKEIENLLGSADVLPYRAGYAAEDREKIEERLQAGTLRGVIATSALEMGIDLPHLTVGINIGVPATRKGYRQRVGRAGRASPGAFIVVAEPDAFTSYGMSFREYHDQSVEDSYLYLDNRFMQFAHARCLVDELEALGSGLTLPLKASWPGGFQEIFAWAKPGGNRPPAFDAIAQIGGDAPHYRYPLRNVGETNFRIAQGDSAPTIGEVNELQALRECYPGATYWHLGRAYEVQAWQTSGFTSPLIRVKPGAPNRLTRPRIRTWINAGVTSVDLLEGHYLRGERGFIAECQMQVTQKVEGYDDVNAGVYRPYSELRQSNPNMRARIRNFRTSGVLLCIAEPWFSIGDAKNIFVERLNAVFAREYSILPQDVGCAATNISVRSIDGGGLRSDCIVVFDQVYGSLRLTERLYFHFDLLLNRLERAAAIEAESGDEDFLNEILKVRDIFDSFTTTTSESLLEDAGMTGKHIRVFAPESRVSYRENGMMGSEVEIIRPTVMNGKLMYQIKCPSRISTSVSTKQWVTAEYIEPTAGDGEWDQAWWNSESEEYEDPPGSLD